MGRREYLTTQLDVELSCVVGRREHLTTQLDVELSCVVGRREHHYAVSYTHLTLPTILRV